MTTDLKKQRGRNSHDRSAYDWFKTFESTLRLTGNVTASCERAGVSRTAAMLIFLLKKQKPEVYGDHLRLEHSGELDNSIAFTINPNPPLGELTD